MQSKYKNFIMGKKASPKRFKKSVCRLHIVRYFSEILCAFQAIKIFGGKNVAMCNLVLLAN